MFGVIVLLIFLLLLILPVIKGRGLNLLQKKQVGILGGYFLVLLSALAVLQFLPEENFADAVSEEEPLEQKHAGMVLFSQALEGRPGQVEGVFVPVQWEFAFKGNRLTVFKSPVSDDEISDFHIIAPEGDIPLILIVERKDTADGIIEVVCYTTKTIVELADFSEKLDPPRVSLEDGILTVAVPEQRRLSIGAFGKEFAATQILGGPPLLARVSHERTTLGSQLLYLRVPAGLEIHSKTPISPARWPS